MRQMILTFLLLLFFSINAKDSIVFSSWAEEKTNRWQRIDNEMAVFLVSENKQQDSIKIYMDENGLGESFSELFSSRALPLAMSKGEKYIFIRPSSKYTSPLYGAHTFPYWVLDENKKIVSSSSVDEFRVLSKGKYGMRDFEEINCFTNICHIKRFEFDGSRYVQKSCRISGVPEGNVVGNC